MNIDEIKNNWKKLDLVSENSTFNQDSFEQIIKKEYSKNNIKAILPEIIISIFYVYLILLFIAFNKQLDNYFHKSLSVVAVIILSTLLYLTVFTTYNFYKEGELLDSYHASLDKLKKQCKRLHSLYLLMLLLKLCALLICIILVPRIYAETPSHEQSIWAFLIGGAILIMGTYGVYKYYLNLLKQNEYLLKKIFDNEED